MKKLITALSIALALTTAPAKAALMWEINGEKGQACYNASAAWTLFNAARRLGEEGGTLQVKVWFPPEEDPFVQQCLRDRDERNRERETAAQ